MPIILADCAVPTNWEMAELQRELYPRFADRYAFQILPFRSTNASEIVLRQPDILKGLTQHRGLAKPTLHIPNSERYNVFGKQCKLEPSYWGEHDSIGEEELTKYGQPGTCGQPIDLTWYMGQLLENLAERAYNRMEQLIWNTLFFGRYQAISQSGIVMFEAQFNTQQASAGVPWTNLSGSFPLRDFRSLKLLERGTSASFGLCARYIMNQETFNLLLANTNPNDVGRIGLSACCQFMSPELINQQFSAQGLGSFVIYDKGYVDGDGNFQLYIPFGYVLVVGCRPNNEPIGNFWYTRNATQCNISTGMWNYIWDSCGKERPPRVIELHQGWNGGPAIHYPRAIVVLRVAG